MGNDGSLEIREGCYLPSGALYRVAHNSHLASERIPTDSFQVRATVDFPELGGRHMVPIEHPQIRKHIEGLGYTNGVFYAASHHTDKNRLVLIQSLEKQS